MHILTLFATLAAVWLVLSGQTTALLLGLGLASVLATVALSRRLGVIDRESHPVQILRNLIVFWVFLAREIIVANLQVARLVLSPRRALQPTMVRVRTRHGSDLSRALLGNAITLTPGTVTVEIDGDELLVHALTAASARALTSGRMDAHVPEDVAEAPR
ncbi:MAG TPA: Na+/H+ antiporter subunit E [Xanthomonadaceae bacterium]|nr:Na+/H+ antiporter subunit E [Xanthomonadaceae bacterium]